MSSDWVKVEGWGYERLNEIYFRPKLLGWSIGRVPEFSNEQLAGLTPRSLPHRPVLLSAAPGPNGVNDAVVPFLGVSHRQQDLGIRIRLHELSVHAAGRIVQCRLVGSAILVGKNLIPFRLLAVVGVDPQLEVRALDALEHVVAGPVQQLLER